MTLSDFFGEQHSENYERIIRFVEELEYSVRILKLLVSVEKTENVFKDNISWTVNKRCIGLSQQNKVRNVKYGHI